MVNWEIIQEIDATNTQALGMGLKPLSFEERMVLYRKFEQEDIDTLDEELPLEQRSYSFSGLGLRKL